MFWKLGSSQLQRAASIVITGFAATQVSVAIASPTDARTGAAVANPTDSAVYYDSIDAKRIWVLPPLNGAAGPASMSLETPKAECDSLDSIVDATKQYSLQLNILAKQRTNVIKQLASMSDQSSADALKLIERLDTINKLTINTRGAVDALYTESAKKHGGTLTIPYRHQGPSNLTALRRANPALDAQPVETYNVQFLFSAPGSAADGVDPSALPIIASYSVAGISASKLASTKASLAPNLDVTLSLTRVGACMFAFPQKFGVSPNPRFGLTALYDIPFTFRTQVRASYNLKSIYEFLQSQGSSGGFFDSSSWAKTVESNWGSSAIRFLWSDTDPDSRVSAADRLEIEKSVKADLLASIDKLVLAQAGLPAISAANPGPRGATVLAEGLEKTCIANAYCAGAAVGMRVLDAIFGSSSSSSSILKKIDVNATYYSDTSTVRYVTRGIVFEASP